MLCWLLLLVPIVAGTGCNNNGVYNSTSMTCTCNSGWEGNECQTPICDNECQNDGLCIGANECQCPVGFDGSTCENINVFGNPTIQLVLGYVVVAITSWVMGNTAPKLGLPKITAYIGVGVLAGSYVLNIIPEEEIRNLDVVDKVSLAYIAFAAGSKPIVGGRSITTVTLCLVLFTFSLITLVMVLISPNLEFTKDLNAGQQGGVAILVGTLACARSPSSAIAIIDDLRSAGPFTTLTIAVTCVMDVLVIFMFAVNNLIASSQFDTGGNSTEIFGKSIARLILSSLLGAFCGKFVIPIALWWWPSLIKKCRYTAYILYSQILILALIGLVVFILDHYDDDLLDALIIAMVAGYVIANHTPYKNEFHEILEKTSTVMYVAFFTLVGASLGLSSFGNTFGISMLFFVLRIISLMAGSFLGGWIANEPPHHNKVAWYAYVTQAGVALGLAKKIHGQFPEWGADFATLIVAMVVLNQIAGPPLYKRALTLLKEAGRQPPRKRGKAVVLAAEDSELARTAVKSLGKVGWQVKFLDASNPGDSGSSDMERLSNFLLAQLTDEVKVIMIILKDTLAVEVSNFMYSQFPDCRIIVQQMDWESKNRKGSSYETPSGLPPDVIVLNPPARTTEQLILAAALSQISLFPSIWNALEEKKKWEKTIQSLSSMNRLQEIGETKIPEPDDEKLVIAEEKV